MQIRLHLAAFIFCGLYAGAVSATEAEDVAFRFTLKGDAAPSKLKTMLTLNITEGALKAVQVYAEPSHTFLGSALDNSGGEPEQQPWYTVLPEPRTPQMRSSLQAGMKGTIHGRHPAPGDTHIMVHMLYERDGHFVKDQFKVTASLENFHFGLGMTYPVTDGHDRKITTATSHIGGAFKFECFYGDGGGCGYSRVACSINEGTCCFASTDGCGWCGQVTAYCGTQTPCSTCPGVGG